MSDVQDPIAFRTLMAGSTVVVISINRPEEIEGDYHCRYLLQVGDRKRQGYAMGIDGVQALQLVMIRINADLLALGKELGVPITWLDHAPGHTGFVGLHRVAAL